MEAQLLRGLTRPVRASQAVAGPDAAISTWEVLWVPDSPFVTRGLPKPLACPAINEPFGPCWSLPPANGVCQ